MNITWSVFPKFFKHLSIPALAELIQYVGLDTTNAVIRDGYWVTREGMKRELPEFVAIMADAGVKVQFATAGFSAQEIVAHESRLATLAESGIGEFRMDYFRWDRERSPAECLDSARRELAQMIPLCEKHGVRAVYQVHHNTLLPSPWAAWALVHDLPPAQIGVMLDPGNQVNEGWMRWEPACHLLGDHLVAMGIKDGYKPDYKTKNEWVPCGDGSVNWTEVAHALWSVDFNGTFVYMPHYDKADPDAQTAKLKREVAFLRKVIANAKEKSDG